MGQEKIVVVTDSSCDLSKETLTKYNIHQMPFRIIYKDSEYLEKVTITPEEMYDRLPTEVPTTSLPDMDYSSKAIQALVDEGYTDIIVITISTVLSGTLGCLKLVCDGVGGANYHFFDTLTLGYPVGVIVTQAAKMVQAGHSVFDVMEALPDIRKRTHGYINVDTLDYLIKGGRLSKTAGAIGTVLNLKPIITYNDEGLYTHSKPRGRKQAFKQLREILQEYLKKGPCEVWVPNANAYKEAQDFYDSIKDLDGVVSISIETIGAAMGIHTGPGVVSLVFYECN
ncbi:MAG: fatty acid-binding protein DegV [Epulopiscium sp. Nele67-Bin004]|nr:MAG: fatty acid-binding protein DegV [Epulopiscium sp. Nele67-Bin004]